MIYILKIIKVIFFLFVKTGLYRNISAILVFCGKSATMHFQVTKEHLFYFLLPKINKFFTIIQN